MTWLSDRALRHLQDVAMWPDFAGTRYTAVDEIGRGGMGTVYRATDDVLGREVAIKVINAAGPHAALAARMQQEARVLARLEHPGIVPVHDAGVLADGRTFYVMKLVRGRSLADHVAGVERLDERLRLFERICEPVAFAHANAVVHRDLKPSNVMVGSFGEVLVLDWGLAKIAEDRGHPGADAPGLLHDPVLLDAPVAGGLQTRGHPATEAGTVVGTPGFMAPEQAGADAVVDARADVYALGAMLVGMLTGVDPATLPGSFEPALRQRGIPMRLRAICLKALSHAPAARYPDAAGFADDVARFRAGLPVSAHRETPFERAARFASTYRTPIFLVLGYVVMRVLVALYTALNPVVR